MPPYYPPEPPPYYPPAPPPYYPPEPPPYYPPPLPPDHDDDRRERSEVLVEAGAIESLAALIYGAATVELPEDEDSSLTLTQLQDVLIAAEEFSVAVEKSDRVYIDSERELIDLQFTINEVKDKVLCGILSDTIREDFIDMQLRVRDLFLRYRLDADIIDDVPISADGLRSLLCERLTLRDERIFDGRDKIRPDISVTNQRPNKLILQAFVISKSEPNSPVTMPPDRARGIANLTIVNIFYKDGTLDPLVTKAIDRRDPHVVRGELQLANASDRIVLDIDPNREIAYIDMTVYGTVGAEHSTRLSVKLARSIDSDNR